MGHKKHWNGDVSDVDDEKQYIYEPSKLIKFIDMLLCRNDFAKRKFEAEPVPYKELFRFASSSDKLRVIFGMLFAVVCGIGQPFSMLLGGEMINILLSENKVGDNLFWNRGYRAVCLYSVIGVCMAICGVLQHVCYGKAAMNIARNLRCQFMRSLLRQDAEWYDHQRLGALNSQLNISIDQIRDGVSDKMGIIVRDTTLFVSCVFISLVYEWHLTMAIIAMGPISTILMSMQGRFVDRESGNLVNTEENADALVEESLVKFKTVAAYNGEQVMVEKYRQMMAKCKSQALKLCACAGFFDGLFCCVTYIFYGVGIYYGGYLCEQGVISQRGDVFVVVGCMMYGTHFLGTLSSNFMAIVTARVAAAVIYETIDRKAKIDLSTADGDIITDPKGTIRFNNVHFSYPTKPDDKVLRGLTFEVNSGETIALVGQSGCGKSTTIGLLTRLYDANSGTIEVDGKDVKSLNIKFLRNIVGVVQQEPVVFNGTVYENVRLGNPDLTDAQVIRLCKMANAHDFITKLDDKYNTRIGAGGVHLSSSQKQTIAIARTLARNPKILLLDEATSALDAESEAAVLQALTKGPGRTKIIIAHRLSTLKIASRILVFKDGVIVESGSHRELLLKRDSVYAKLVRSQRFEALGLHDDEESEDESWSEDELLTAIDGIHRLPKQQLTFSSVATSHFGASSLMREKAYLIRDEPSDSKKEEKGTSEEPEKVVHREASGLWKLYNICDYRSFLAAVIISVIRGMELLCYAVLYTMTFNGFSELDVNIMMAQLKVTFMAYLGLAVGCVVALGGATYSCGRLAENVVRDICVKAFESTLGQKPSYFDDSENSRAIIVTRMTNSPREMKPALDSHLMQMISNLSALISLVASSLYFCWQVGLLGSMIFVILVLFLVIASKHFLLLERIAGSDDLSDKIAVEIVEQIQTVQLLTREKHFSDFYEESLCKACELHKKSVGVKALIYSLTTTFGFFTDMGCYGLGIYLIYNDKVNASDVVGVTISIQTGGFALILVAGILNAFINAGIAANSLLEIIEDAQPKDDSTNLEKPEIEGKVIADKVSFSYSNRPQHPVLDGLTFAAAKDKTVAFVGPTGSGKSIIVDLLERFYDPVDGIITIDSLDIKNIELTHLRENISLVEREPILFNGTIAENVMLGCREKSIDDVRAACESTNASTFIEALPLGYETEIGEKGAKLSSGQKQRIAIARALIREPKILLLHEISNTMDVESEKAVREALDRARNERTCIVIAHRLSSIQDADLIFYMEKGRIAEVGTHKQLMKANQKYAALVRKQRLDL